MGDSKKQLEDVAAFIREHRNNEANVDKLYAKLDDVMTHNYNETLTAALQEIKEKAAAEYKQAAATGGTAWPEFERFVSEFETTVIDAIKEA